MYDSDDLHDFASHIVLHAWVAVYLRGRGGLTRAKLAGFATELDVQAIKLRESAIQLQIALEKMRVANEKLAARMAEHKAFFAKYQRPQP